MPVAQGLPRRQRAGCSQGAPQSVGPALGMPLIRSQVQCFFGGLNMLARRQLCFIETADGAGTRGGPNDANRITEAAAMSPSPTRAVSTRPWRAGDRTICMSWPCSMAAGGTLRCPLARSKAADGYSACGQCTETGEGLDQQPRPRGRHWRDGLLVAGRVPCGTMRFSEFGPVSAG